MRHREAIKAPPAGRAARKQAFREGCEEREAAHKKGPTVRADSASNKSVGFAPTDRPGPRLHARGESPPPPTHTNFFNLARVKKLGGNGVGPGQEGKRKEGEREREREREGGRVGRTVREGE